MLSLKEKVKLYWKYRKHFRHVIIVRSYQSKQVTLGVGMVKRKWKLPFFFYTLELPWKENRQNVSCIPCGKYWARKWDSNKHGHCIYLEGTAPRGPILIHPGNWVKDSKGCILVGRTQTFKNATQRFMVTHSRATLDEILSMLPEQFDVVVKEAAACED